MWEWGNGIGDMGLAQNAFLSSAYPIPLLSLYTISSTTLPHYPFNTSFITLPLYPFTTSSHCRDNIFPHRS